jgi:hypothetical protein
MLSGIVLSFCPLAPWQLAMSNSFFLEYLHLTTILLILLAPSVSKNKNNPTNTET